MIRERLRGGGWDVVDTPTGSELQAIKAPPSGEPKPKSRGVTLLTVVHGWKPDAERWLLFYSLHAARVEILDGVGKRIDLEDLRSSRDELEGLGDTSH